MKDRCTMPVCCHADGSENFEPIFIGNSERPRPFRKNCGLDYGLDYHFNAKAWMTATFLNAWLRRFNAHIRRAPGRKNSSANGKI